MMQFLTLSLWSAFVLITYMDTIHAILPECTFTTTSGFCTGMAGRFIRRDHNPKIRALYIVNSDLSALTADDFAPFQSLSTLHINNCTLPLATERSLLSDLKDLNALQITHSNLSDDIRHMFVNNTALNNLSLQRNKITQIRRETFSHLTELDMIDVSNNEISDINEDSFINLKKLKKLVLTGNKIGEHFNPTFFVPSSGECGMCATECLVDAASSCELNKGTDYLWRAFEKNYDTVVLKENPICYKLENKLSEDETINVTGGEVQKESEVSGCTLYQEEKCSKLRKDRANFFSRACKHNPNRASRRSRNHDDDPDADPEVFESAPEVDGEDDIPLTSSSLHAADSSMPLISGEEAEFQDPVASLEDDTDPLPSSGPVPSEGTPTSSETANISDRVQTRNGLVPILDGDESDAFGLPPSSVEVADGPQAEKLSQFSPQSVIAGAAAGVVAFGVGAALVIFVRRKRTYRHVDQSDNIEMQEMNSAPDTNNTPLLKDELLERVTAQWETAATFH